MKRHNLCLFLNTVCDTVVSNSYGDVLFNSEKELMELGKELGKRCLSLVPKDFFKKELDNAD